MKQGWIVELKKAPIVGDFRDGFFPREFHYKKDAVRLAKEVEQKGGEAIVKRKT